MHCLENHLVMIEYLFGDHPRIQSLNKKLCNYMLHNGSPIDVYRIVRHLMPFSYVALISILVEKEVITYAQAAYFSLVDASYDLIGYFLLVDHYSKKVSYQVSGGIRWEKKCGLSSHY